VNVLYVNHTPVVSGAEESLQVLLRTLPDDVAPTLACPRGPLADAATEIGVPVSLIPGTELSARLDPIHTSRGLADVGRAAIAIRTAAKRASADLIHANTPRAGLICARARGATGTKPLIHIRDSIPPGRLPQAMFSLLARNTSTFIATTQYLADEMPRGTRVVTVPNAIEADRFDPGRIDRGHARERLGLGPDEPVLAVVGQISPHKRQTDAVEVLQRVRRTHPTTRLLVVGSVKFTSAATRYDNRSYAEELSGLTTRLGLEQAVSLLGERSDIAEILAAVDVLLVPSAYEPFGRVALEGMMMRVPVVATSVGGTKEVLRDGVDGIVLEPGAPDRWGEAVSELLADPDRRKTIGAAGRERALTQFDAQSHARTIVDLYRRVLDR
jgi:glycosyltransferase involved in cell wall biosynthesis